MLKKYCRMTKAIMVSSSWYFGLQIERRSVPVIMCICTYGGDVGEDVEEEYGCEDGIGEDESDH
jgi:hypothetical protein